MRRYRPSLTVSIMAFLFCMLVLTWLLFSVLASRIAASDLYAQKGEHARTLLVTFINQLPEKIPTFPEGIIPADSSASIYVQKLSNDAAFTRLTLLDANGKPILSAGRDKSDVYSPFSTKTNSSNDMTVSMDSNGMTCVAPVIRNGVVVGRAGLSMSLDAEKARLSKARKIMAIYFFLDFVLLFAIGSYILSRIVVNPISRILSATEKITKGVYGQELTVSGSAEIARLADSFNDMSRTLQVKNSQLLEQVATLEQINSQLSQAREESLRSEKMASLGLLAAGMAHEVGTPLMSIMGYAELLAGDNTDNSAVRDYAERISQDCQRIDRIVRGLLDYSRPRSYDVEVVDMVDVASGAIELLAQQGIFKSIELSTVFDDDLPDVLADPHQLQQVMINLIINARDAMPDGGRLVIRLKPENSDESALKLDSVRLDVLDSGEGIAPEHIPNLFEPFFTTKQPGKGTGLGLAMVARIVQGFNGSISVQSKQGTGSCFTVLLPVANQRGEA